MEKWIDFYAPFFESLVTVRQFVEDLEKLGPDDPRHCAKIMMHQAQRLVSLAADLPQIRPKRESLQLLFLLICAEHISKLHADFDGEGQSRAYTRRFFEEILSQDDRNRLVAGFSILGRRNLTVREVVDLLYDVRCDVVHEGRFWGFSFHDGQTPMLNADPDVIANMTLWQLRAIVVRGCLAAVTSYAGRKQPSPADKR